LEYESILVKCLVVGDSTKRISKKKLFQKIYYIVKNRGLPRFLFYYNRKLNLDFESIYSKNRMQCLYLAFRNPKTLYEILNTIYFEELKWLDPRFQKNRIDIPHFPDIKNRKNLSNKTLYVNQSIDARNQSKNFRFPTDLETTKLHFKLLNWNSYVYLHLYAQNQKHDFPKEINHVLSSFQIFRPKIDIEGNFNIDFAIGKHNPFKVIANAEIWNSIFIVKNQHLIIKDATENISQKFVAGHQEIIFKTKDLICLRKPKKIQIIHGKAFILSKRCDENWFHAMCDLLPQLIFTSKLPSGTQILIKQNLPESLRNLLKIFCNNVIEMKADHRVQVEELYYLPHRSVVFDSKVKNSRLKTLDYPKET
jgi:hypothetical protein